MQETKSIYNLMHYDFEPLKVAIWESVERTIERYNAGKITLDVCVEDLAELVSRKEMHSTCAILPVNSWSDDNIRAHLDLNL